MSEDIVTIPLNKLKIGLSILGCVIFVVVGIMLWLIADSQALYNPTLLRVVGAVSVAFFGLIGLYVSQKIFDNKPGLILDSEGLIDNSSGVSAGRVRWDEITRIGVTRVGRQRFLTITVLDPQKYVERGNAFQQKLSAINLKQYGSPVQISSGTLKMGFEELAQMLVDYYERYT